MASMDPASWATRVARGVQSPAKAAPAQRTSRAKPSTIQFPALFRMLIRLVFQAGGTVFGSAVRSERMGVPLGVPLRRSPGSGHAGVDLSRSDIDIFIPVDKYDGFIATINSIPIIRGDDWTIREIIPDPTRIPERRNQYGIVVRASHVVAGSPNNDLVDSSAGFQLRTFELNVPGFSNPLKLDIATSSQISFSDAQDVIMANMFIKSGSGNSIRIPRGLDDGVIAAASISPFQDTLDELHNHHIDPKTGKSFLLPISSILFPAQHTRMDCCSEHMGALKAYFLMKRIERFMKVMRAGIIPIHGKKMGTKGKTFIITAWDHLDLSLTPTELAQYKGEVCPITQIPLDDLEHVDEFHGERPVVITADRQVFSLDGFKEYVQSQIDSGMGDRGPVKCPITGKYIK